MGYALYGIATYLTDPTQILWYEKLAYRDVLTSTFVNRNTAAVYFGSCAILWLLLLSQNIRHRLPSGSDLLAQCAADVSVCPLQFFCHLAMLLLCVAAMLMTNSRAGVVVSLMALVIAFIAFFHRDLSSRGPIVMALAVSGMIALLVLQVLGGNVSGRFDVQGLSERRPP